MRFINRIIAVLAMLAVVTGLTTAIAVTPASAADTGTEATFSSSFNGTAKSDAQASGVATANASATGKILLEELRAQIPQSIQDKWKAPTREQINRYGTLVHSLDEANAVVAKETKVYDRIVNKARAKVAKLKLRIKHKDGDVPKLKKQLKKAKKALTAIYVDKNWKYRPLIGLARGVCYTNTGRLGNMGIQSFKDCVGDAAHPTEKVVWIGLNPNMREMRIVAVELTDGTIKPGCLNIPDFELPPWLPDESLFLMVGAFAGLNLYVAVGSAVTGVLTVRGEIKQNGVVCASKTEEVKVDEFVPLKTVTVSASDTDEAIAFAENQVQADAQAMASAATSVQAAIELAVSKTMTLSCPPVNNPPTCELVQFPQHVYVSQAGKVPNRYRFKVVWNDADQQLTKEMVKVTVTGQAFIVKNNPDFPEIWDVEGTQLVYYAWLESTQQTGNATLATEVKDPQGATCTQSKSFPVVPDEF